MINIESNVEEVIKKVHRFPTMITMSANRTLHNAAIELIQIMRRVGLKVTYPINWDSEIQKIAFFASNGFGRGIPTQRSGEHANGFAIASLANGYEVSNIGTQAVFLYGTPSGHFAGAVHVQPSGQSHIFAGRWRLISEVIRAILNKLPQQLRDSLKMDLSE